MSSDSVDESTINKLFKLTLNDPIFKTQLIKVQNQVYYMSERERLCKLLYFIKTKFKSIYKKKILRLFITKNFFTSYYIDASSIRLTPNKFEHLIKTIGSELRYANLSNTFVNTIIDGERVGVYHINQDFKFLSAWDSNNLHTLILSNNYIKANGARHLASGNFRNLIHLNLGFNYISDAGLEYISNSKMTKIKTLILYSNKLTDVGICFLTTGKMREISNLCLDYNDLTVMSMHYLSEAVFKNKIEILSIPTIVNGDFRLLKKLPKLKNLQIIQMDQNHQHIYFNDVSKLNLLDLNLSNFRGHNRTYFEQFPFNNAIVNLSITKSDLAPVVIKNLASVNFVKLKSLNLSQTCFGEEKMTYLASGNFTNLENLDLSINVLNSTSMKFLAEGNFLNLKKLKLSQNAITDNGASFLAQANFTNLTDLDLSFNVLKNNGVIELCKATFVGKLLSLGLAGVKMRVGGLKNIARTKFEKLEHLILSDNTFSNKALKIFNRSKKIKKLKNFELASIRFKSFLFEFFKDKGIMEKCEILDLSLNQIDDGSIMSIPFERYNRLKILKLNNNNLVTRKGLEFIVEKAKRLICIEMRHSRIKNEDLNLIYSKYENSPIILINPLF